VAFGVLDFVDSDSVDLAERGCTPSDDMFDGIKNLFPGGTRSMGCFFPGEAARPAGQEELVGPGQGELAVARGTSSTTTTPQWRLETEPRKTRCRMNS
jgi:hypothetical protein